MKELSDNVFISFLYAERDRLFSQHNSVGWNVWVIVGALFWLLLLIIDIIAEKTPQAVPLIGISVTFLVVGFFILMSLKQKIIKETTPFKNRYNISGVNNTPLLNTITLIGISFLLLYYGFWCDSKIVVGRPFL